MYDSAAAMGDIPLRTELGNVSFLRDVATPKDAAFIQTNVVRINGRSEVYIPVFRQLGASTLGGGRAPSGSSSPSSPPG